RLSGARLRQQRGGSASRARRRASRASIRARRSARVDQRRCVFSAASIDRRSIWWCQLSSMAAAYLNWEGRPPRPAGTVASAQWLLNCSKDPIRLTRLIVPTIFDLAPVIADVVAAHCGRTARERFLQACVFGHFNEAKSMIEGVLAEPWHLRGHQEA